MRSRRTLTVMGLLLVLVGALALWGAQRTAETPVVVRALQQPEHQLIEAGTVITGRPGATCATAVPFNPTSISVEGVSAATTVIAPPRDANGVPGTPPITGTGKSVFAWDSQQGIRPGDPAGNVLLNAHTFPDGSALGNRLLDGLQKGGRIVLSGYGPAQRLCYRVTERVEVDATKPFPRYFDTTGPAQLAIVVCSGQRLGPGQWTKRTIWFASPQA